MKYISAILIDITSPQRIHGWEQEVMEMKQLGAAINRWQIFSGDRTANRQNREAHEDFTHLLEGGVTAALQLKKRSGRYR